MACPECGGRGRFIKPATLQAQIDPLRLAQLASDEGWALCMGAACEVGYFRGDVIIVLRDIKAMPFHKGTDTRRFVCFCFGHSVAAILADVEDSGESRIRARIKAACGAGDDDCIHKNPTGRCCLGNVGQVIKAARPATILAVGCDVECCAGPRSAHERTPRFDARSPQQ